MSLRSWMAAGLTAAVLVPAVAGLLDGPDATQADRLDQELAAHPGVPFVLPRELPDGVAWFGSGPFLGDGRSVEVRTAVFTRASGTDTVTICSAVDAARARSCPGTVKGNLVIRRAFRGVAVRIGMSGEVTADAEFWRTVPLSLDTHQPWLD